MRRIIARLAQEGMRADVAPAPARAGNATVILTVRSS
jgi:hypothetical protein